MKKFTFLCAALLAFCWQSNAQHDFATIVGPTNVAEGSPVAIAINDVGNSQAVPSGTYVDFTITADWAAGGGGPYSSEADATITTTAGSVTIDPATTGSAFNGTATTLTFSGTLAGPYDPDVDGYLEISLNQSYSGSDADWSNIVVTISAYVPPPTGSLCTDPIIANTLPYTATGETTAGFGDDYSGSPGASGCGTTSSYLNGDDIVYAHTASADGSIDVNLTNITDNYTGVFIYSDCADIGTACGAGDYNGFSTADLSITNYSVTNGNTYYIVVSTYASPQTTSYDLSIAAGATCTDVSGLTLDSVTTTTATISWTAAGSETDWEIAVQAPGTGAPGAADGSGTDTTTNPHTASGLTASTAYEVYVRAECTAGTDFGGWVGPLDFTTACNAISTFPWTEDFESITTPDLALCWSELNENADGDFFKTWTTYGVGGSIAAGLYTDFNGGSNDDYLILPQFTLTGNERLKFNVRARSTSEPNDYRVVLSTTGTAATDFSVELQALATVSNTTHAEITPIDLSAYTGNVYIAIHVPSGGLDGYYIYFDDFTLEEIPACPDITGLTIDSFTAETAEISWTAGGTETDWEVLVQADGTGSPELGTPDATINNPYSATGLTELTAYEVYVRSDCGGGQLGAWVGPADFTTTALCPDVSGITIDSFTGDSVTVSWTANGSEDDWEVLVQPDGTGLPASGTATTNNPHTESGLTGNTAYEVYVRADCNDASNGYSEWVGPVDFTTGCTTYTPDYTEDFTVFLDDCWEEANGGDLTAGPASFGTGGFDTEQFGNTGSNNGVAINMYSGGPDIDWLLSPSFDLSADGYELVVDVAMTDWEATTQDDGFNPGDEVRIVYSNDGTNWTTLTTYNDANVPAAVGQTEIIDLSGITGSNVQFAFYVSEGTTGRDIDFHIDNFTVRTPPTCPDVTSIVVSSITTTSAQIDWTNGGSESNWEIAVQAAGTGTPGAADGSGTDTATNPYNATGLNANTAYEVYVRAECVAGVDFGAWVGPINFATGCDTFSTFPYSEGFESGVPPTCWTSFRGTNGIGTTYDWTTSTTANSGSGAAYVRYSAGGGEAEDWLVTPEFDMTALTNPELSFYSRDGLTFSYGSVFTIRVSTTDTDHASFTTIETYPESDITTYQQYVVDLSAYAGESTVYVAFVLTNDDGDSLYIDDVFVWDNVPTTFTYTSGSWAPFNPMGFASSDDDIVIAAGDFVLDADMTCDRFDVLPGAGLIIDSGVTLTTADILQLQSSSTSYSSLILDGTVSGSILYDRHVNINGTGTTGSNDLVSAPLTGQAFNTFAAGNPNILNNGTLYLFGPFEKNTGTYVNWAGTETSTLDAGVGYRAATSDNSVVTFTGTAENGIVTNDIINGGTNNEEWNLVGNPYPSYLNVQNFLLHDVGGVTNLQLFDAPTAAIYGYDGSALNGWTIYNLATTTSSTVMAPGQGFMISANAANTAAYDIEFAPNMRRTGSSDDFIVGRNPSLTYLILNVRANSKSYNTDFYFNANATQGFDLGYDAGLWGSTAPDFALYSHLVQDNTGTPMALQALSQTDLNDVIIPLGVNANQGEQITFSIEDMTLPASVNVYLEDVVTNTITLLNDSDYVMTPNTALSGTGRFFLRTSEDALSTIENSFDKLDIFTLKASDELVVSGQLLENSTLSLYDIQGRLVLTTTLDSTLLQNRLDVSKFNSGVYVVTVKNNGKEKTKKVIID
jgi:hypothetical protein